VTRPPLLLPRRSGARRRSNRIVALLGFAQDSSCRIDAALRGI